MFMAKQKGWRLAATASAVAMLLLLGLSQIVVGHTLILLQLPPIDHQSFGFVQELLYAIGVAKVFCAIGLSFGIIGFPIVALLLVGVESLIAFRGAWWVVALYILTIGSLIFAMFAMAKRPDRR
jgi:hypothetical protein